MVIDLAHIKRSVDGPMAKSAEKGARKMVSTMSAMWKTNSEYDEKLL